MKNITTILISLLTITSSATANNTNPDTKISATVLTGSVNNNTVVLNWSSANNSRFEIERSFYSNDFSTISALQVPFANTAVKNFRINDNAAELAGRKIAYYRVKQTNANGTITYSNVTVVNLQGTEQSPVVKKNASINFTATQNGNALIKIQSLTGQTAAVKNTIVSRGNNTVELENITNLSKGIYTAVISINGVVVDTQKVVAE